MAKHSQARHLEDVIIPPIQAETSRLVEEAQLMRVCPQPFSIRNI